MTPITSNLTTEAKELLQELEKEIAQHKAAARFKSAITQILFWTSILASGLAGINIATKWFLVEGVSILAAIPGVVLLIHNTFNYSAKARWHKLKEKKFLALRNQLKFQNQPADVVSKNLAILEEELENLRVQIELPKSK